MTVTIETIGNGFKYDDALMEAKKRASRKCEILLDNVKKGREVGQNVTCIQIVQGEYKIVLQTTMEVKFYEEEGSSFGDIIKKMD